MFGHRLIFLPVFFIFNKASALPYENEDIVTQKDVENSKDNSYY